MINCDYCIIGAGPAGLAAAHELVVRGHTNVVIIDKNAVVGGLARTIQRGDHRFDIGPHRFFTKNGEVEALWKSMLGSDLLVVDRVTRIYHKGKYFTYPIDLINVIATGGIVESLRIAFSFLAAKLGRRKVVTFEDWTINAFGRRLYETFFKAYTEKVWGIPCNQIEAKWASQRIRGLNLLELIRGGIGLGNRSIKSMVNEFYYPRHGAGQLYERIARSIADKGVQILLNHELTGVRLDDEKHLGEMKVVNSDGKAITIRGKHIFNSSPLTRFIDLIEDPGFVNLGDITKQLLYRDHITVNMVLDGVNIFNDQWIYVHDEDVKMARVANYNNFSKEIASGKSTTGISVEYFAKKGDPLWELTDEQICDLAYRELDSIGIVSKEKVIDYFIVREIDSYPAYYLGYEKHFNTLRDSLSKFENFSPIGRGGLFKYNNQDHSILTGLFAVRNLLENAKYDLWNLNSDSEYLEERSQA